MADDIKRQQDNKDAESGEPVQLDKEQQSGAGQEDVSEQGDGEELAEQGAA